MARARRFANVAACRGLPPRSFKQDNRLWFYSKTYNFATQNVGHLGKKVAILKFCLAKDISLK